MSDPVICIENVSKLHRLGMVAVWASKGINLEIEQGETNGRAGQLARNRHERFSGETLLFCLLLVITC